MGHNYSVGGRRWPTGARIKTELGEGPGMRGGRVGLPEHRPERGDGVSRGSPEQSWMKAPGCGELEDEQGRPQEGNVHRDKGCGQ